MEFGPDGAPIIPGFGAGVGGVAPPFSMDRENDELPDEENRQCIIC